MRLVKAAATAAVLSLAVAGCATTGTPTVHVPAARSGAHSRTHKHKGGSGVYRRQTPRVDVSCFPPRLRAILGDIHRHFGRTVVVTSGYRPRSGRSQHARCKAADIRVPGVSPARIAAYARSLKAIGGVGTYRHKGIVHVDVGPRRNWRY